MTSIIYDTDAIGKAARLKALDGTPQNVVAQPMAVETPAEFDGYGMYAGFADTAPAEVNPDWTSSLIYDGGGSGGAVTLAQAKLPEIPVGFIALITTGSVNAGVYPAVPHVWTGYQWAEISPYEDTAPCEINPTPDGVYFKDAQALISELYANNIFDPPEQDPA